MKKYRTLTKIGFALGAYTAYKFIDGSFSMLPNQGGLYKLGTKVTSAGFGAGIGAIVGHVIEEGLDIWDEYQEEKNHCKCSCHSETEKEEIDPYDEGFVDADILKEEEADE